MQIVGQTWLNLVTMTCGSWSEDQHDLYFTVQWFCLISWRLFYVCISYFGSMNQYDSTFDLKINVGHCDLYFVVQWFCLISWRLFDIWTSLFGIMNQYDLTFDLKINVGHCDLFFMVQWFCIISWRLFAVWTSFFWIGIGLWVVWSQNKCMSLWPIFHGPVTLPYISKTIFQIIRQCDPNFDLKINIGQHDLYFMV